MGEDNPATTTIQTTTTEEEEEKLDPLKSIKDQIVAYDPEDKEEKDKENEREEKEQTRVIAHHSNSALRV